MNTYNLTFYHKYATMPVLDLSTRQRNRHAYLLYRLADESRKYTEYWPTCVLMSSESAACSIKRITLEKKYKMKKTHKANFANNNQYIDTNRSIPEVLYGVYKYLRSIEEMDYDEHFPDDKHISKLRCLSSDVYAVLQDFIPVYVPDCRIKMDVLRDQAVKYHDEDVADATIAICGQIARVFGSQEKGGAR